LGLTDFFAHFGILTNLILMFTLIDIFIMFILFDLYHFSRRSPLWPVEEHKHVKGYDAEEIHYNVWYVTCVLFGTLLIDVLCLYSLFTTGLVAYVYMCSLIQYWNFLQIVPLLNKAFFDSKADPGLQRLGQVQFRILLFQCICVIIFHIIHYFLL